MKKIWTSIEREEENASVREREKKRGSSILNCIVDINLYFFPSETFLPPLFKVGLSEAQLGNLSSLIGFFPV